MSDQQRKGEGYESLDDLFDQQLAVDLLGGGGDDSRNLEPEPQRQQPQPRQAPRNVSDGGYGPIIAQKEKEIAELEKKIEGFRSADSAYIYTDEDGNKQFDHSQHRQDEITLRRLDRELDKLIRRRDDAARQAQEQGKIAYRVAKRLLEERVKRLPKKYQQNVVKMFGKYFKEFEDSGYWGRRDLQDTAKLQSTLADMLDTVIGRVAREDLTASPNKKPGDDVSMDDYDEPDTSDSEEDDPFTEEAMLHYRARKANSGKTIGQIRREQAKRAEQERQQARGDQ